MLEAAAFPGGGALLVASNAGCAPVIPLNLNSKTQTRNSKPETRVASKAGCVHSS